MMTQCKLDYNRESTGHTYDEDTNILVVWAK